MNQPIKPWLESIRARPAMFFGNKPSLTGLSNLIAGWKMALSTYGLTDEIHFNLPPHRDFSDWCSYRLHFEGRAKGWQTTILERSESESAALSKFFELLDEYRARKPHLVAKLIGYQKTYTQIITPGGTETICHYPDSISLITYTDDPGFFAYSDDHNDFPDQGFQPSIDWFESFTGAHRGQLTIIDHNWNFDLPAA